MILTDTKSKEKIIGMLEKGVQEGVFPGAVLLVSQNSNILFHEALGSCSRTADEKITKDTIFDLASLTKPLMTTMAMMKCVDKGMIDLDQPLNTLLPAHLPLDKKAVTPRQILAHCAGFREWEPFYLELIKHPLEKRKQTIRQWIMDAPLMARPGTKSRYSDLGYMVLEWLIEETTGELLHSYFEHNFISPLSLKRTFLFQKGIDRGFNAHDYAATEDCAWRKTILQGTVHDENAHAMGGYSGHAGLFGTAEEVFKLVDLVNSHYRGDRHDYFKPETVTMFLTKDEMVKKSTWALGWDTPTLGQSSSGKYFSENSVGHLGFTGTSVWIDLEKDIIVILLTNRVHPSRENIKIKAFRPLLHDMIMEEMTSYG